MIFPSLFCLTALLSFARADSAIFSQYIGATTASAAFAGDTASAQSNQLTICTNYLHALQAVPTGYTSLSAHLQQIQADGVCQFCTSISQSRVDSCCGDSSSVACFEQFAPGAKAPATTAHTGSLTTPAANSATGTGSAAAATATATKASTGNKFGMVHITASTLVVLSCLGLALL